VAVFRKENPLTDLLDKHGQPRGCRDCGEVLDPSNAVADAQARDGYRSRCRDCHAKRQRLARLSRGARWAEEVRAEYVLAPHVDVLLDTIAPLIDRIDQLDEAVAEAGSLMVGSRIHPAVSEARATRAVLHRMLSTLDLPVGDL
jgi:hypothetical protein